MPEMGGLMHYNIGKAHQRIIREKKEKEQGNKDPLFGDWWEKNHRKLDIKNAEIREITYQEAKPIILEYEWLGTMGTTKYHYGIFFNDECGGVVCYGYFQAPSGYKKYVGENFAKKGLQLSRGACCFWAHPHSASKLISHSLTHIAQRGYKYVIAFSDPEAGEIGTVYQATNWICFGDGDTGGNGHLYYKSNNKLFLDARDFYRKYGIASKRNALKEFVRRNPDFYFKMAKPKKRYIKLIGSHKENKTMMMVLKDYIEEYPKRAGQVSRGIH